VSGSAPGSTGAEWGVFRKSRFSESANCVEIAFLEPGDVLVRNSRHRDAAVLAFTADEWSAFVQGVSVGEFHHPTLRRMGGD
jgi:hypothetical protein